MQWLSRMTERLRRMMIGRYGVDQLSFAMLILSMVLTFISSVSGWYYLSILSWIILIICALRMLSTNLSKRFNENRQFLKIWNPTANFFKTNLSILKDKDHKYFKCPNCKQKIRVPRGRGKINIVCPKCRVQFIKKT